jgi:putative SOS response-associated peptidase YedK
MCGRYTLIRLSEFTDLFPWIRGPDAAVPPRYNIAPMQPVAAVANVVNDGKHFVDWYQWGLVPSWAKDTSIASKMINARAETVAEKPSYKAALRRRRCAIPASGFYEWKSLDGRTKQPMYVTMADEKPFAFAGLWEVWEGPTGDHALATCTVLTTKPNELMESIHDRMPVILDGDAMRQWLTPGELDPADLLPLLRPFAAEQMLARPVSRAVNHVKNDLPECVVPVESETLF